MKLLKAGKKKKAMPKEYKYVCPHCNAVLLVAKDDIKNRKYTDIDGTFNNEHFIHCLHCEDEIQLDNEFVDKFNQTKSFFI